MIHLGGNSFRNESQEENKYQVLPSETSDAHVHNQKPCSVPLRLSISQQHHRQMQYGTGCVCLIGVTWDPPEGIADCSGASLWLSQVLGIVLTWTIPCEGSLP